METELKIGGIYRNWKTKNLYKVHGIVKHSETLEPMVYYEALYDNPESKFWVRPLSMFTDMKEKDGKKVPRFTFVE